MEREVALTCSRLKAAVLAGDVDAVVEQFAFDAVLHPPTSDRATLRGREQIRELYSAVLSGALRNLEYAGEIRDGDRAALFVRYRVGARAVEEALWLRFNGQGLVAEMWSFVRPLVGLTAMSAAVVPRYAARHAAWRGRVVASLARSLAVLVAIGDPVGTRVAGVRRRSL